MQSHLATGRMACCSRADAACSQSDCLCRCLGASSLVVRAARAQAHELTGSVEKLEGPYPEDTLKRVTAMPKV